MEDKLDSVLIVDDEVIIRRLLRQSLTQEGYQCQEAGSAEAALSELASCPPDVMMLDVMMPGRSGMELLPEIKTTYPDTAVIMATAVTDAVTVIECMREGADDYICKPFDLDEVNTGIQRVLAKRRVQQQVRGYQLLLEDKVGAQTAEIKKLTLASVESLVIALEAKDRYTAGHSRRVADMAVIIGTELGLPNEAIDDLRWGGLLHDVGKIAVDQMVQNKPGRLTEEEYQYIMIHAHVGAGIVKPVVNERVVQMIEHHHDRYDGHGLNQTVSGTEIPLGARILAVADTFDAMTSERPYRLAMPKQVAFDEIKRCAGTQFDQVIAEAFLNIAAGFKGAD